MEGETACPRREPWNKGKLVGQKTPFKPKKIWAIRVPLQMAERARELALFNLGIDSKLRACDLTALRVRDICHGDLVASRATVLQRKTQRPMQFEITAPARKTVQAWIRQGGSNSADFLFPSRRDPNDHIAEAFERRTGRRKFVAQI
jgi:integrase